MASLIFLQGVDEVDTVLSIRTAIISGNFVENGGLTVVSWNSENTSVTKQWAINPLRLLEECNKFLQEADPATYGRRVTRTRPAYRY
jgi:hypothetical protein